MPTSDPTVATREGPVRGLAEAGLCVFRGIPFAAAPESTRRFQPPRPAPVRAECLDASQLGPAPPQRIDALSRLIGIDFPGPMREDCLQLNIWTPAVDAGRRPVMVWIHGGAFTTGSGTASAYAGERIAARGDVVVVTLNYRVGALGFLHLAPIVPGLGGPNLGLLDQIAALQWLKREIAGFGGDPSRVTVFGESAGAGSLTALLAMPAARGLFQRAILQSAAPDGMLGDDEACGRAGMFLDALDSLQPGSQMLPRAARTREALEQVPVDALLDAQQACIEAGPHRTGMFFAPVIDGDSLPKRPLDAIAEGSARDVQVMIGTTQEEMQLYATIPGMGELPDEVLVPVVASRLEGSDEERQSLARRAVDVYRQELGSAPSQQSLFFALETDLSLRQPSIALAEAQALLRPETFMYLFRWRSPASDGQGGRLGACHAVDLPFTFGCLEGAPLAFAAGEDPADHLRARELSDHVIDAWTAFARHGDPTHRGIGAWPPYDAKRRATMIFDVASGVEDAPLDLRRAIWKGFPGQLTGGGSR